MQILLRYPTVHSRMDNPETPLTLNTRRRTKTNSKNKQHKTNNRSNTDPIKSQGWTNVLLKVEDNPETPMTLDTRHRTNTNTKTNNIKLIIGAGIGVSGLSLPFRLTLVHPWLFIGSVLLLLLVLCCLF
jgi:Flp pilus assembly protein TadG